MVMSIPSMRIFPVWKSTKRNNERATVDFPDPVDPTIPILSPPYERVSGALEDGGKQRRTLTEKVRS